MIVLGECFCKLASGVLHAMPFVYYNVLPVILVEIFAVSKDELVGCNTNIPFSSLKHFRKLITSLL